ncbi:MAG: DJ-1/PfpI family protein [Spirochaetales bacterium]|nr:DJ-1/PfpI family protein [Spirochaetales bacterium]
MAKAALLLAEGFEEVEAVTPADFLNRAGIDVLLAGIGSKTVTGSHGITIQTPYEIGELPDDLDAVIIPGGLPGAEHVAASGRAIELIRKMNEKGKYIAAICAAPAYVLEKSGVIKGKKVTCYPGCETRLSGSYFSEDRVVVDGNIITSRGPGTAAEFAIVLIEVLAGKTAAETIHRKTLQK